MAPTANQKKAAETLKAEGKLAMHAYPCAGVLLRDIQ